MSAWTEEILSRYAELLGASAPQMVAQGAVAVALIAAFHKLAQRDDASARLGRPVAVVVALVVGLWLALGRASVVDDAYVSLRYARNLVEGHGLVWNPGEWVEGYTNFLWTVMLAAASVVLPFELPLLAAVGALLSFVGVVVALGRAGSLLGGARWLPPAAALLYAVQYTAVDYATTGLETTFAALCVLLGLSALLREVTPRSAAVAGTMLILGVFNRPDHALFWLAGGATVLFEAVRAHGPRAREAWLPPVAFAASFAPYALYLAWKLWAYGELVPNTYYAKSGDLSYFSQGGIYSLTFFLGAHVWLLLPAVVAAFVAPGRTDADRRLLVFAALALPVYLVYVAKVGGDFMYGRFYVVTLPVVLLLAESGLRRVARSATAQVPAAAVTLAALLGAGAHGVGIIGPEINRWYITDESRVYRIVRWTEPLEIDHSNWHAGRAFRALFTARGLEFPIATTGIGMMGYYSRLELIDMLGLTDATVAREPLERRRMPGHEKRPDPAYLDQRDVLLYRTKNIAAPPKRWHKVIAPRFPTTLPTAPEVDMKRLRDWKLFRYDAADLAALRRAAPEVRVGDFGAEIDRWLLRAARLDDREREEDVAFFERFYFAHTDDPRRREQVRRLMEGEVRDAGGASPDGAEDETDDSDAVE